MNMESQLKVGSAVTLKKRRGQNLSPLCRPSNTNWFEWMDACMHADEIGLVVRMMKHPIDGSEWAQVKVREGLGWMSLDYLKLFS